MGRQVVSVSATGQVSGLQTKPGKGFDLRALGPARIERASEIVWCPTQQLWFVEVRRGQFSGRMLTNKDHATAALVAEGTDLQSCGVSVHNWLMAQHIYPNAVAMFAEYDDAVACEIVVLDHWRKTLGSEALA